MDDETIDNIFQGVLEDLPRPTSKVLFRLCKQFLRIDMEKLSFYIIFVIEIVLTSSP